MDPFVRNFIRSSLVWLGTGVMLGLWTVMAPAQALVYRPVHVHAGLLGFVSMMVFGVAYHVMPRFVGVPLWSRRLAEIHLYAANAGLVLMLAGWLLRPSFLEGGSAILLAGGVTSAASTFLFITNLWRTLAPTAQVAPGALDLVQMRRTR